MSNSNLSIIRRGNHFIYLPPLSDISNRVGWALIDGPWYNYLSKISNGKRLVEVFEPFSCGRTFFYRDDEMPQIPNVFHSLVWEKIGFGSCFIHPKQIKDKCLLQRWGAFIYDRRGVAFRLCPNGRLPAYFNQVEFEQDYRRHKELLLLHG